MAGPTEPCSSPYGKARARSFDDRRRQGLGRLHRGVEDQVVGRPVVEVDAVDGLVAGPLERAALGVVDQGLGDRAAVARGDPGGPHLVGAVDPDPDGRQAGRVASQPARRDSITQPPSVARASSRSSSSRSISGCPWAWAPNSARVIPASGAICRNTSPPGSRSSPSAAATRRETVVVPEPGSPEMVISKRAALGEGGEQRLALLLAETADAAGVGDADLLHRAARLHLADAGQRLDAPRGPSSCRCGRRPSRRAAQPGSSSPS